MEWSSLILGCQYSKSETGIYRHIIAIKCLATAEKETEMWLQIYSKHYITVTGIHFLLFFITQLSIGHQSTHSNPSLILSCLAAVSISSPHYASVNTFVYWVSVKGLARNLHTPQQNLTVNVSQKTLQVKNRIVKQGRNMGYGTDYFGDCESNGTSGWSFSMSEG